MELNDIISSGILELYATGMASPEETRQVEQWLVQFPELRAELSQIEAGLESYAKAHAITPPAGIKNSLMQQITNDSLNTGGTVSMFPVNGKQQAVTYTIRSFFKWAAAACFILLLGSLILTYIYYDKYQDATKDLANTRNALEHQKTMAADMDKQISMMTDKNALPISLNGTDHAPEASAKIFWMKNTGDVYLAPSALPKPRPGMQYQLWAIIDGKPVDGGMITNDRGDVYHIQKMKSFGKADAFAITLEREGGSENPNMKEMYVSAKVL